MTRQKILSQSVDVFNFSQIEKELLAEVEGLIKKLSIENGKIVYNQKNINIVNDIEAKIKKIVSQSKYRSQVNDYLKNFEQITEAAKKEQRDNDVKIGKIKFSDIQKTSIDITVNKMLGTGLDVNFVQPVKDIVFNSIVAGGSVADAELQLKGLVIGDAERQGKLTRYATQIARDSIYGYDGRIQSLIASELGMDCYSYEGSLIKDSRPQCVRWVEDFSGLLKFTELKKEIAWAYKNGTGMIPDTTPDNFAMNRGGYNCRHTVTAVFCE